MSEQDPEVDRDPHGQDSLREQRRQQSASVRELLEEAIEAARAPQNADRGPLLTIVGLLDQKPVNEWGASEYAKAMVSLQNVEGEALEQRTADNVQTILRRAAADRNISAQDLAEEEAQQTRTLAAKTLNDFAEEIVMALEQMTPAQQEQKHQEIQRLSPGLRAQVMQMIQQSRFIIQSTNAAASQQRGPMSAQEQYMQQMGERDVREKAAMHRIYEEHGEDMELYTGSIDETIAMRMDRILNNPKNESEDSLRRYYADLQKWVGTVLKNDSRENDEGKLVLKNDRYEKFKEIIGKKFEEVSWNDLRENVRYLQDEQKGRLTRYFKQRDGNSNERNSAIIGFKQEGDLTSLPNSIDETMDLIQRQYGSKYATGGEYELIDVYGEFHVENFFYWARERTNFLREQNPAGAINPLSDITVRTLYSAIPLAEILQSPQFRKQRRFDISGNEDHEGDPRNTVDGHWGPEVDHPKLVEDRSLDLLYELAFYSQDHSMAAKWFQKRGEKAGFLEGLQEHMGSWISRGNWTTIFKRPSRKDATGQEFEEYFESGQDGTLGRAMREMVMAYRHMVEFTEFHTYQKGDRRLELKDGVSRKVGERKHFNDNLFYKYLEADGSNAFLLGLAEGAFKENANVVNKYQEFIGERLDAAAGAYRNLNLTEYQQQRLNQLVEKHKGRVSKNMSIAVNFDTSADLQSFHSQVKNLVLEEKVDKEAIAVDVQKDLLTHIKGGFFEKIKSVQVLKNNSKTGRVEGTQNLGDVKINVGDRSLSVSEALDGFDDSYDNYSKYVDYRRLGINQPDTSSAAFEAYVKKNEEMASVLTEAIAGVSRKELNYFRKAAKHFSKTELFDAALRKGIAGKAFGLDSVETTFLGGWAKNMLYGFGIAGENDTSATGFDYWTRISNTADYLEQQDMKGYPIVEPFMKEVSFLGQNMFDMLMVRRPGQAAERETLGDIFMGGVGESIKTRDQRILDADNTYKIDANAQQNVYLNNLRNAAEFVDKLRNGDFHFDKITKTDFNGNTIIDKKRAVEEFTKLWTNIRYSTDQHGMDYTRLASRYGKIDDVMHLQFGKHTRTLLEEMQKTLYPNEPMAMSKRPGIGVFAALVGAVLEEHRGITYEKRLTIQQINELEYLIGGIIHKDPKIKKYGTRIPPHIWDDLLIVHGIGFRKMMQTEAGFGILEALYFAAMEGLNKYSEAIAKTK